MKMLIKTIFSIVTALAFMPVVALAGHHEGGDHAVAAEQMGDDVVWASGARAIVAEVEGEVIAVDMETREVVVRGPAGNFVTLSAREDGVEDVAHVRDRDARRRKGRGSRGGSRSVRAGRRCSRAPNATRP